MALSAAEIEQRLAKLQGWKRTGDRIFRHYQFKDFTEALAFVNKVGELAEKAFHHPDISIHEWNKVTLEFTTHDEGGLTEKDFALAGQIEALGKK
jgi:4a-hydroxytetrahydrobiopterin dehydratase